MTAESASELSGLEHVRLRTGPRLILMSAVGYMRAEVAPCVSAHRISLPAKAAWENKENRRTEENRRTGEPNPSVSALHKQTQTH